MRRRRIGRNRLKHQKMMLTIGALSIMMFLTVGYAAFQTNINLSIKGNVKRSATTINGGVDDLEDEVVTTGSGLYDNHDGTYTYKGADPYNYITFNNELWRIISINANGQLKIIKDDKLAENRSFDSNGDTGRRTSGYCHDTASVETGCNVWSSTADMNDTPSAYTNGTITGAVSAASDLYTYLNTTYYNDSNLTDNSKIVDTTFNIGPGTTENAYTWTGKVGLLTESEFTEAGGSNSYLVRSYEYWLMNPTAQSSTNVKTINAQTLGNAAANTTKGVRPVVTLTCDIHLSGKGIRSNPFILSAGDGTCSDSPAPTATYVYRWSTSRWNANQDISSMTAGTDYVTSASAVTNMDTRGANYYLKYKIENNIATESYVCFITDVEYCLRGGTENGENPSNFYSSNVSELTGQQSWFTSQGGSCTLNPSGSDSYCTGGPFYYVIASSVGNVAVYDPGNAYCNVASVGNSRCYA